MADQLLEFRGIPLRHLLMYLEELGGKQCTRQLPFVFQGDGWQAVLLREEIVAITSRFHVNAVFIRFSAGSEETLQRVVSAFRKKTLRVGG